MLPKKEFKKGDIVTVAKCILILDNKEHLENSKLRVEKVETTNEIGSTGQLVKVEELPDFVDAFYFESINN